MNVEFINLQNILFFDLDVRGLDFFADVNWDQVAERKSSQFLVEKLELTKKFTFDPSAYDSGLLLGDNEALKGNLEAFLNELSIAEIL